MAIVRSQRTNGTNSFSSNTQPSQQPTYWWVVEPPTRANIDRGLQWIKESSKEGDSVFIHYSGHGARLLTRTSLLDNPLKAVIGVDEALVPMDYPTGAPLRDVDFGNYLDDLATSTLQVSVFVVLDYCHSASGVRAGVY